MKRKETNVEQKHARMRRHEIPKTATAHILFVLVEDDRKVTADGHEFPDHEQHERIVSNDHKLKRYDEQSEKPEVPANRKTALDVRAQVADRIKTRGERKQLKCEQEKER